MGTRKAFVYRLRGQIQIGDAVGAQPCGGLTDLVLERELDAMPVEARSMRDRAL